MAFLFLRPLSGLLSATAPAVSQELKAKSPVRLTAF